MISFKRVVNNIKTEIFPIGYKCICCGEELSTNTLYSICDTCMAKLPFNTGKRCVKCSEPINSLAHLCLHCKNELPLYKSNVSVFLYKSPISDLIRKFKYDNCRYLAYTFTNFIAGEVVKMDVQFDIVVPVPLYKERLKFRGFNQSYLLCKTLGEKLKLKVEKDLLIKIRNTSSQANLTRPERQENIKDAFSVTNKAKVKGKTVLIVDDVFTTGTTINECAKTLLDAGAKDVYSITLAHADSTKFFNDENKK